MNIQELHREAISLAKMANIYLNEGDLEQYKKLILEAYLLEKQAAEFLNERKDVEPTRSVLYRSAANLAFKCEKYAETIELITQALSGNPFEEIKLELLELLKNAVGLRTEPTEVIKSNNYLNSIRERSVNLKLEEKTGKYAGAFAIPHAIELMRAFSQSYQNYAEAQFTKAVEKDSIKDYDYTLNKFKNQCILLGANSKFSSFGISLSVDNSIMDHFDVYTKDFKKMKFNLFSEFKEDVVYPNYEDPEFQKRISKKFTDEYRRKIFSPVISLISKSKGFKISIVDNDYKDKIKEFIPLNKVTKELLSPISIQQNENLDEDENISLTKKIEQTIGNKKTIIHSEQMKYFELENSIDNIEFNNSKVYLDSTHTIVVIFEMNYFRIEDSMYQINVSHKDHSGILYAYNKYFITKFKELLSNQKNLSIEDAELLTIYESTTVRDW